MNIRYPTAMLWSCMARWATIGGKMTFGKVTSGMVVLFTNNGLPDIRTGMLRFRFGPQFGAVERKFFLGLEVGFEYSYVFRNGCEFVITQKNNVNFLHGDTFRNGLLLGMKIPF